MRYSVRQGGPRWSPPIPLLTPPGAQHAATADNREQENRLIYADSATRSKTWQRMSSDCGSEVRIREPSVVLLYTPWVRRTRAARNSGSPSGRFVAARQHQACGDRSETV